MYCDTSDEEKVLQQVIQDTEQVSLEEEEGVALGEEGEGAEVGSAAALLDEFVGRFVSMPLLRKVM